MRKPFIAAVFTAALAAAGVVWYAEGAPQHRKPTESAPSGQQPAQPRQPPQATPRDGQKPSPDTPRTGQAVPRPPDARNEPDRPRRGPERPPVIVPYAGWPWWTYPYPYPYGYPPTPWRVYADWETASVRLDVSPNEAQVYVDRFYAGVVDDFDGIFQRLTLRPGPHLIEIRKDGYRTLAVELNLYAGQSVTYRRTMEPATGVETTVAPGFDEGAVPPVSAEAYAPPGDVRLDVTPKDAAVYADGYYAGIVDDFNGPQHLLLAPGRHHLSIRLGGYESIDVDLTVDTGQTTTYRAALRKVD
jgi:PEGA domain-containing protein